MIKSIRNRTIDTGDTRERQLTTTEETIEECLKNSKSRIDFWINFLRFNNVNNLAELGVYRGDFAEKILNSCDSIKKYYMIDPWRHLDDWNKPGNQDDNVFELFLSETISKTEFAASKRIILRGKTTEVIEQIPDHTLDFAYIDGDHTLRGITIDLIKIYNKIKNDGWIGGDDFSKTLWQHGTKFEPTFVFPFAVYFAEASGAQIFALPNLQFLIHKNKNKKFSFIDLTGNYNDTSLRKQCYPDRIIKLYIRERFPFLLKIYKSIK